MTRLTVFAGLIFVSFFTFSQPEWKSLPDHPDQNNFQNLSAEVSDDGGVYLFYSVLNGVNLEIYRATFDFESFSWASSSVAQTNVTSTQIVTQHKGEHMFVAFLDQNLTNDILRVYHYNDASLSFSDNVILPNANFVDLDMTIGDSADELFIGIATDDTDFLVTRRSGGNMTTPVVVSNPISAANTIKEIEIDHGDDFLYVLLRDTLAGQGPNQFHNHLYRTPDNAFSFTPCGSFGGTMQTDASTYFRSGANELIVDDNKVLIAGHNTQGNALEEWTYDPTLNSFTVNSSSLLFRPDFVGSSTSNASSDFYFSLTRENQGDMAFPRVYERSLAGVWTDFAGPVLNYVPSFDFAHASVSENSKHLLVTLEESGSYTFFVSNEMGEQGLSSFNLAHCENSVNSILYSGIGFTDPNKDSLWVVGFDVELGQGVDDTNFTHEFLGQIGGQSFFRIYLSSAPATTISNLGLIITDGYDTTTYTLPETFIVNSIGVLPSFVDGPFEFCSNEPQVILQQFINTNATGRFFIGADEVPAGIISNRQLQSLIDVGPKVLRYKELRDGCLIEIDSIIEVVEPVAVDFTISHASDCSSDDGQITASFIPSSGTPTNYFWSNGERNTATIDTLSAGQYYIAFTDLNGCKVRERALVLPGGELQMNPVKSNVSCFGGNDGSVQLNLNISSPYTVLWSNGSDSEDQTNLSAGVYEVIIRTESGCKTTREFIISQPSSFKPIISKDLPNCGDTDGILSVQLTGGTQPYNFSWNGNPNEDSLVNIGAGIHSLLITDANGCTMTRSVTLSEQNSASLNGLVLPSSCALNNGEIDVTVLPAIGTTVSSISWDNGAMTEDIMDLAADDYVCTATMSNGCKAIKSWTVDEIVPERIQVCAVSVDIESTSNLIIWERPNLENIHHFNVYRESNLPGDYQRIGVVPFDSFTVFNDVVAGPLDRSWRYVISAVDSCGVESAFSFPHKSMQLVAKIQNNDVQLTWDEYEGKSFDKFYVWRQETGLPFEIIDSTTNPSFIDTDAPINDDELDYYVSIGLETPCFATFKAEDFRVSRSNRTSGVFNPGQGSGHQNNSLNEETIRDLTAIYPNPFKEGFKLINRTGKPLQVSVFDVNVRVLHTEKMDNDLFINSSDWTSGIYFVQLRSDQTVVMKRITKE